MQKRFSRRILEFSEGSRTREFERNAIPSGRNLENGKPTI